MKFRYQIIIGRTFPLKAPFNVQRQHFVDGRFYSSGHGHSCKFLEQAMEWIVRDKATLNRDDTAEVCIVKI